MRRFALSLLLAAVLGGPALAAEQATFTPAALQAAQAAGKPVIVHVTATWCSTCAAQAPVVKSLLQDPKFKDLVLLNVDFDKQKAALRQLHVQAQSTFVAYKGKTEVGRSMGETEKAAIKGLFDKTS